MPNVLKHDTAFRQEVDELLKGRTKTWLAEQLGVTPQTLNNWLGHSNLDERRRRRVLRVLGTDVRQATIKYGRAIMLPLEFIENPSDPLAFFAIKHAWMASWLREHGAAVLDELAEAEYAMSLIDREGKRRETLASMPRDAAVDVVQNYLATLDA